MIGKPHIKIRRCGRWFVATVRGARYHTHARSTRLGPLFWARLANACRIAAGDMEAKAAWRKANDDHHNAKLT